MLAPFYIFLFFFFDYLSCLVTLSVLAGLEELRAELLSQDWLYGRTPRFTKTLHIHLPQHLHSNTYSGNTTSSANINSGLTISGNSSPVARETVRVEVTCRRGVVEEVRVVDGASAGVRAAVEREVVAPLLGVPYTSHMHSVLDALLHSTIFQNTYKL